MAQKLDATVVDHGDRVYLFAKGCAPPPKPNYVMMDLTADAVR